VLLGDMQIMLKTLNAASNVLRTLLLLVIAGILGMGGWVGYKAFYERENAIRERDAQLAKQQKQIEQLNVDLAHALAEAQRLELANKLLKVDHRIA
jgi:predicted negative regulator of RcsB-dependent stress response